MRRQGVLTSRGKWFVGVGAVTTLAGVLLGFEDVTRIGLLVLILPLLTALVSRRRLPAIRVTRDLSPSRLQQGEHGEVEVRFTNVDRRTTALYLAEEEFDYALGDRPRFLLPRMSTGEHRRLVYRVRSHHRGAFALGPVTLRQRDLFGLTHVTLQLPTTHELLVLPQVHDLGGRRLRGQGRGTEGDLPQMVALHGEDDVSIRQYRDGDELRRVHWPATAHRGELMVRQEDRPTRRRAVLVLDSRAVAHGGEGYRPSFEWAVSAIASVARHLAANGFLVHLITDATLSQGTADEPIDVDEVMAVLARARTGPSDRLAALAHAAHAFTSGGVHLIAAVVAKDEQQLRELAAVAEPGSHAMALVLDPVAFESDADLGDEDPGLGPARRTADLARVLGETGWQTTPVGPRTPIPQAWADLRSARSLRAGG